MSAPAVPVPVPPLGPPPSPSPLDVARATLDSGLRVLAVHRPGVPLVEVRLRVPMLSAAPGHLARTLMMGETLLTGAPGRDRVALASAVGALGADLNVGVDADRAVLSGSVLAANLTPLLEIAGGVLADPAYPDAELEVERARLLERLAIARSQAGVIAREARSARMFGDHPYGRGLPSAAEIEAVTGAQVRDLHGRRMLPDGAVLVLVGDLPPEEAFAAADKALSGWIGAPATDPVGPPPAPVPGALELVDRRGSVQSSIRMGATALRRDADGYQALVLANMIFGGYFSSRWNENLREDKGYTYGPHSRIEHDALGSTLLLDADVASEVTAPALLETYYELGRISALPVTNSEVDNARQYAIGTFALSTATQAGLATTLAGLTGIGLGPEWMQEHPRLLAAVTTDQVSAAAAEFFAPSRFVSVIVGDDTAVRSGLERLTDVAPRREAE
jgi:predicted Zn-dependent peptidase